MTQKPILDPCCGSKMFWFDKNNPLVTYCDVRQCEDKKIWEGKDGKRSIYITIQPDLMCSVTNLPFPDKSFYHVVFDPPHLLRISENSWLAEKYGRLDNNWKQFISDGFSECWRVLKTNGTLAFKWAEVDIKVSELIECFPVPPLYGHRSGKHMTTHWLVFFKED